MSRGLYLRATLDDQASPKLRKIRGEAEGLGSRVGKVGSRGREAFAQLGQAVGQFGGPLGMVAGRLGAVAAGVGAVVAAGVGFKKFVDTGFQMNATLEKIETQFKVVTGSAAAASAKMREITEFSASTPFQLGEVADAARMLTALAHGYRRPPPCR